MARNARGKVTLRDTYAAAAANISTRRAFVKIAKTPQNRVTNKAIIASRKGIPLTKYNTTVETTGSVEERSVVSTCKIAIKRESSYSENPASSSFGRLAASQCPMYRWNIYKTLLAIQRVNTSYSPGLLLNATRSSVLFTSQREASPPRRKLSPDPGLESQVRRNRISCSMGAVMVSTCWAFSRAESCKMIRGVSALQVKTHCSRLAFVGPRGISAIVRSLRLEPGQVATIRENISLSPRGLNGGPREQSRATRSQAR